MARVSYGDFIVLNPTPFKVKAAYDRISPTGAEYNFEPYQEIEIKVKDHVNHICDSNRNDGLVELDYNADAKKLYATYEDYKVARSAEGIRAALAKYGEALTYEQAAYSAAKHKDQVIELRSINVDTFEEKIDDLQQLLGNLKVPQKKKEAKVKAKAPAWMTKEDKPEIELEAKKEKLPANMKKTPTGKYMIDKGTGYKFVSKKELEELGIVNTNSTTDRV